MPRRTDLFTMLSPYLFTAMMLLIWEFVIPAAGVPVYVIPPPTAIIDSLSDNYDVIIDNTYLTLIVSLVGIVLGCGVGGIMGVLMAEVKVVERILLPYVIGSNAIPVVAVAPLIVLWFGHGVMAKGIVAAFLSFFPIAINIHNGLSSARQEYRDLFSVIGATKFEFFLKYKIIHSMPFAFSGLKISGTLAVVGAVVAEFISPESGIGFGMLQATYNLDTPRLFGYIFISCLLGLCMYGAGACLELWWKRRTIGYLEKPTF